MKVQVLDVVRRTIGVNLRYSSALLNLTKDYIKDFEREIRKSGQQPTNVAGEESRATTPIRHPILLVGQANEVASSAFVLNNTGTVGLEVNLVVETDPEIKQVQVIPTSLSIAPSASAIVRLKIELTENLTANRDYFGKVLAPGLSNQAVELVVRRLPN